MGGTHSPSPRVLLGHPSPLGEKAMPFYEHDDKKA